MKKDKIVKEAQRYAQQQGWRPQNYAVVSVKKAKEIYVVFFQGKSGQEGDHFSVIVDAATGKATKLVPGR